MAEEFEFTIGFQKLTGLTEEGTYGIAWRKGQDTGRTKRVPSNENEVHIETQVKVTEIKRAPTQKAKQLFEVYVNRYTGEAKQTIGMLYMDLTMHIPKAGKPMVKQSACLQLSNCVEPSIRLALTVQCQPKLAAPVSSHDDPQQTIREMRDEISNLKRQNERLKEEDSYTYSNQPVRHNVKALEDQIAMLTKQLHETEASCKATLETERLAMEAEVTRLQDAASNTQTIHASQVAEYKATIDALKREHSNELAAMHDKINSGFRKTIDDNKLTTDAHDLELTEMSHELAMARKEVIALKRQLEEQKSSQAHLDSMHVTQQKDNKDATLLCEALATQKTHLSQRLEQVGGELNEMKKQSYEERVATEEAKQMLSEMMEQLKEAQNTEDSLQAALAVADEEKLDIIKQNKAFQAQLGALQSEMQYVRHEELAVSHVKETDLLKEVETHRVKVAEATAVAEKARHEVQELSQQKEIAETTVQEQKVKLAQRKNRISDLKRILGLHLKMKQAQMIVSDGLAPADFSIDLPIAP